jgi:hypothetical protein
MSVREALNSISALSQNSRKTPLKIRIKKTVVAMQQPFACILGRSPTKWAANTVRDRRNA